VRDAAVDVVAAGFVVHLVEDPAAVLAEARRVLVPGGTLGLSVPRPAPGSSRWAFMWPLIGEYAEHLDPAHRHLGGEPDLPALLADAGFADVERWTAQVHLPVADVATFWRWVDSHGLRAYFEALPPGPRAELRGRMDEAVRAMDQIVIDWGATFWRATARP
jgi:SAM-dependent methyltransferase